MTSSRTFLAAAAATILGAALLVPAAAAYAGVSDPRPVTLLQEDFALGTLAAEGWSSSLGPADIAQTPVDGGFGARMGYSGTYGQNLLSPVISTADMTLITVTYRAYTTGTSGALTLNYFDAGSTLHTESSTTITGSTNAWVTKSVTLSTTYADDSSITLAFTTSSASGTAYVDDVVVTGISTNHAYTEEFQAGTLAGAGWTSSLGPATVTTTIPGHYVLQLGYTGTYGHNAVSETIDLDGLESVRLRFDAETASTTSGAQLRVGYFHDGGQLEILPLILSNNNAWATYYAYLGSEANDTEITLVFFTSGSGTGTARVDNIFLDGIAPGTATGPTVGSIDETFYATSFENATDFADEWINANATRIDFDSSDGYASIEFPHTGAGSAIQLDPIDTTAYTGSGSVLVFYTFRAEGVSEWDTLYVEADYNLPGNTDWVAVDGFRGNTDGWITRVARVPAPALDNDALDLRFRASGSGTGRVYVDDVQVVAGDAYMPLAGVPAAIDPNLVSTAQLPGSRDAGLDGGIPANLFLGPQVAANAYGIAVTDGYVYWTEYGGAIKRVAREADGRVLLSTTPTTVLTVPAGAFGIAVDESTGDIFYGIDAGQTGEIRWYTASNATTTTIVSGITRPRALALDASGNLYAALETAGSVIRWNRSGGTVTTIVSGLAAPQGIAVTASELYVQEYGSFTNASGMLGAGFAGGALKRVDLSTSAVTTVAGSDDEHFWRGRGLALRDDGSVLIANEANAWDQGNSGSLSVLDTSDDLSALQGGIDYPTFIASDGGDQVFFNLIRDTRLVTYDAGADFDSQNWSGAGYAGLQVTADGGDWVPDVSGNLTIEITAGGDTVVLEGTADLDVGSDVVSGWVAVPVALLPDLDLTPLPHPSVAPLPGMFTPPTVSASAPGGSVTTAVIPLRTHERARWPMLDLYTTAGDFSEAPEAYLVYFEWQD